jgi:hypothetical protein
LRPRIVRAVVFAVEIGEFFSRGHECGGQSHGPFERRDGLIGILAVAVDEAEQIVGLGKRVVSGEGAAQRIARRSRRPGAIPSQGERIEQPRVRVRQPVRSERVPLGRLGGIAAAVIQVAERLERLGRVGGEPPCGFEIPNRAFMLLALAVGFAAPVEGRHRVGPKRQGAAERLDRHVTLAAAHRGFTLGEQPAVLAVAPEMGQQRRAENDQANGRRKGRRLASRRVLYGAFRHPRRKSSGPRS